MIYNMLLCIFVQIKGDIRISCFHMVSELLINIVLNYFFFSYLYRFPAWNVRKRAMNINVCVCLEFRQMYILLFLLKQYVSWRSRLKWCSGQNCGNNAFKPNALDEMLSMGVQCSVVFSFTSQSIFPHDTESMLKRGFVKLPLILVGWPTTWHLLPEFQGGYWRKWVSYPWYKFYRHRHLSAI